MVRTKIVFILLMFTGILFLYGCASTLQEAGNDFSYNQSVSIVVGRSTKNDIVSSYGNPTKSEIKGKYEVLTYYYARESLKHGRAIGMGLLSAATGGVSDLVVDHGVRQSDTQQEFKEMVVYADIMTGIVKDYYYHDSDLNGQDESETLYLRASALLKSGGKKKDAYDMLEKSISLNPQNHRALNTLAWEFIDNNIDIEKGLAYAKKAVEIFPDNPFNNGTLGVGYLKKNDLDNAEKYLQAALNLYPVYYPRASHAYNQDKARLENVKAMKNKS